MANARRFGNAALTYASTTHVLAAPLREVRPVIRQRRFVSESLDLSVIEIITVGAAVYEIVATIRYEDVPGDLLTLLREGANGVQVNYVPDVSTPGTTYPCTLLFDGDAIELAPDRDTWWDGEYEVTVRLRRNDGGTFNNIL